jgi:predicted ATP-dependent protease
MDREFLKTLGIADEATDKIMSEYGKALQAEKDRTKAVSAELETYKTKVTELEKTAGDNADVKKQLDDLKAQIAEEKRIADEKAADEALTATIRGAFPKDRKFVNSFTEDAYISQIKAEMGKPENKGKGVAEIFTALTKDKADIFANPNTVGGNMGGFGGADITDVDNAKMRRIMGLPAEKKE